MTLLTLIRIVFLVALAVYLLVSDPPVKKVAAFTAGIAAALLAVLVAIGKF